MKRKERSRAEKMFLEASGDITNREIAKALKVNPLTVGRWKSEGNWADKLNSMEEDTTKKAARPRVVVRKKAAQDKASQIYITAGGNISNKDLAKRIGVSPATVSKWKQEGEWEKQVTAEELKFDMGDLISPDQIVQINRKIDSLLSREHSTAREIAELAGAKSDLLNAVLAYMNIVRELEKMEIRS